MNQDLQVPPGFDQITNQIQNVDINNQLISQKLLNRLKNTLNDEEQQMFLNSFIGYLKYDQEKDFVVDLDNVWQWIGYSRKDPAKKVLIDNFEENKDYIFAQPQGQVNQIFPDERENQPPQNSGGFKRGPQSEKIFMTINTFKEFSMLAGTKKSRDVYKYYIKMERCMQDQIKEDAEESRKLQLEAEKRENQLIEQNNQFKTKFESMDKDKFVYIGQGLSQNDNKYKIGCTTDLKQRKSQYNTGQADGWDYMYKQPCIDDQELEKWIKYILTQNKYHHQKEIYNCQLEYIKSIYQVLGSVQDTLLQTRQYCSKEQMIQKIVENMHEEEINQELVQSLQNQIQEPQQTTTTQQDHYSQLFQRYFSTTNNKLDIVQNQNLYQAYLRYFGEDIRGRELKKEYQRQFIEFFKNLNRQVKYDKVNHTEGYTYMQYNQQ